MVELDFSKNESGLVPAIAQDAESGEVLMLGYMNREAWEKTLETGRAIYWSRTRERLWTKGERSGNVQLVKGIRVDCDRDTVLLRVEQVGGVTCHEGYRTCFYRRVAGDSLAQDEERVVEPDKLYG